MPRLDLQGEIVPAVLSATPHKGGVLHVRNQLRNIAMVGLVDKHRLAQFALPLGAFLGQNMAGEGLVPTDFSGAGFAKTLGRTSVGFNLWHVTLL